MPEREHSDFIVCVDSSPVIVRINGKANYLNCSPVNDFFEMMLAAGHKEFLVDFASCHGMDSTFLGVLAGVACKTMQHEPPGSVILANMSPANKQLIRGLGLHHLPTVVLRDDIPLNMKECEGRMTIRGLEAGAEASPDMILEAHERLMKLNRANERRFQDVVKFLRKEAQRD